MRERLLEIITTNNRKMNPMEIMNQYKENSTVEELRSVIHELDLMCRDGILRTSTGNTYVLNDLLTGVVDMHEKGNAHVIIKGQESDIFIPKNALRGAKDKDVVSIEVIDKVKGEGRVVKVLKRSLGKSLAEVINENGELKVVPLDKNLGYEIEIEDNDLHLVDGHIVHLEYIRELYKGKVLARIDSILGHKNAPGHETQIAMIASEFGISMYIPEDAQAEAKLFPKTLDPEEIKKEISRGRKDLRGDIVTTMDGKDTKDIDDAIQIEMLPNGNYKLIVHIADVSHYVKMGSAIWRYAEEKGNSDYLANKVGPMLPVELSNGICSLNPDEDRFALSCIMEIDHSGNIVNPEVSTCVIRSKMKMNYDAVQDIIEGKETEDTVNYTTVKYTVRENETAHDVAFKNCITVEELLEVNEGIEIKEGNEINVPVRPIIKLMSEVSKVLDAKYHRRGKSDFESSEIKHIFDENDNVIDVVPREQRPAESIIENFMICANEAYTTFMCDALSEVIPNMIPFVFRIHETPNPRRIEDFMNMLEAFGMSCPLKINPENVSSKDIQQLLEFLKEKENYRVFSHKLLRCMQKARYSPDNLGHFGIASDNYAHFTAPIRRMADLLIHTIFKVFIVDKDYSPENLSFWGNYLVEVCEHISECERNSAECEYAVDDYFNAELMKDKVGQTFEATIDGTMQGFMFVQTNDKYIDGRVQWMLSEDDSEELLTLTDRNEIEQFIEEHKKPFLYNYNENVYGYTNKGRVIYRYGDKVIVQCIGSDPEKREIDFALVRKA